MDGGMQLETPLFASNVPEAVEAIQGRKDYFLEKRRKVRHLTVIRLCVNHLILVAQKHLHACISAPAISQCACKYTATLGTQAG